MKKQSAWTRAEIESFRAWHANRLVELAYPPSVVMELTEDCNHWLSSIPVIKS